MKYVVAAVIGLGGGCVAAEWLYQRALERGEARKRGMGLR